MQDFEEFYGATQHRVVRLQFAELGRYERNALDTTTLDVAETVRCVCSLVADGSAQI